MVVYIGIGNSDDKLSQRRWVCFQLDVRDVLRDGGATVLGDWHSHPDSIYQNACFAIDIDNDKVPELKGQLAAVAVEYEQDAIAWNEVPGPTLFLGPAGATKAHPKSKKWAGNEPSS